MQGRQPNIMMNTVQTYPEENTFSIFVPMKLKKRGGAAMVILPKNAPKVEVTVDKLTPNYDYRIINALAKAYKWQKIMDKQGLNISQLAAKENISDRYVSRILRLNYFAPDIVAVIIEGKQPKNLRLQDLITKAIPNLWEEQKSFFGF